VTSGGFGSAVLNLQPAIIILPSKNIGIPMYLTYGTIDELQQYCNIDVKDNFFKLVKTITFSHKHNKPEMKLPHNFYCFHIFNFNKPILAENYYLHCSRNSI
jgi:hypothetical protein